MLTDAELRVLRLLPGAASERDIGEALFLSFNTVHTHVRGIYRKLGVSSRADAVTQGVHPGLAGGRLHLGEPARGRCIAPLPLEWSGA